MTTTTANTKRNRFNQHRAELHSIATSLGREDIFERDLRGEGGLDRVPVMSDEAIDTAVAGIGWYLREEHEYDGEQGYELDPRVAQWRTISRFVAGR
jgi:hypothetical protein